MDEYREDFDEQDFDEQQPEAEGPRMVGDWVVTNSIEIGGKEIVMGYSDAPAQAETPYMVCKIQGLGEIPMELYDDAVGGDYVSMVLEFAKQLHEVAEQVRQRKEERGITETFTQDHCLPDSINTLDLTGRVLVVNPQSMAPESQTVDHQLVLAETGFGCKPGSRGRKVYGKNLYTGKNTLWYREDFLGVVKPECIPEWAKKTLKQVQAKEKEKNDKGER